jgi:hypothetical protein
MWVAEYNDIDIYQVDSLDTLALFGDKERFTAAVQWLGKNLRFDKVSVVGLVLMCIKKFLILSHNI